MALTPQSLSQMILFLVHQTICSCLLPEYANRVPADLVSSDPSLASRLESFDLEGVRKMALQLSTESAPDGRSLSQLGSFSQAGARSVKLIGTEAQLLGATPRCFGLGDALCYRLFLVFEIAPGLQGLRPLCGAPVQRCARAVVRWRGRCRGLSPIRMWKFNLNREEGHQQPMARPERPDRCVPSGCGSPLGAVVDPLECGAMRLRTGETPFALNFIKKTSGSHQGSVRSRQSNTWVTSAKRRRVTFGARPGSAAPES